MHPKMYIRILLISMLTIGVGTAQAAVTCRAAIEETDNDSLQLQTIMDRMAELQELSKTEMVDFEITELLAEPVFALQGRFTDTFKLYSDVIENIVPGLRGKASMDVALGLSKDLENLARLTNKEKDFLTSLKGLIPGLISRQTRNTEVSIRVKHKKALSLLTEIRSDNDSLKSLERELRALSAELQQQLKNQEDLKDYFQKMIWDFENSTDKGQSLTIKHAALQTDNHIKTVKQTIAVIGGIQTKIESTARNNLKAFESLQSSIKRDLPHMQVLFEKTGIKLEPQSADDLNPREEEALKKDLDTGLKELTVQQKFEEFQTKIRGFKDDVYNKYLNKEINRWGRLNADDILYVISRMSWMDRASQKGSYQAVYKAFPLIPLPFLLKEQSWTVEFLTLGIRFPLLTTLRLGFGKRVFLNDSQLIVLKLLRKLNLKDTTRAEFERLQNYLSQDSKLLYGITFDYDHEGYLENRFFRDTVVKYLQKKQSKAWF